ncbi:hypothetical protein [Demequina sp. NBRC 110057]|uniref:hypothetical protein n=1 Tax=Demequina sp. NBRC 110057 TaxID=1570346 RepID=UPI000A02FFB2|nr:hypothetical protein [Demequina sp. NBRC 110057]
MPTLSEGSATTGGRLLPLNSWEAKVIVGLFIVTNALFAIGTSEVAARPWMTYLAVAVAGYGAVVIVKRAPFPFPRRDTAIVLATVVVSTALVFGGVTGAGALGRATWHLGSNTWLLFFLAMRGRPGAAWLGMALMLGQSAVWGAFTGRGALAAVMMSNSHVGILIVATLFARQLSATADRIAALRERAVASAAETAAADAGLEIRRTRAAELASLAVPLLERIRSGGPFDADERAQFARTEARLRDGVRGRSLALPDVVEAVEAARMRGIQVTILDDRGTAVEDGEALRRMVETTVGILHAACSGSITVRLLPAGRSAALSIVHADGDEVTRRTLDAQGHPADAGVT